MHLDIKLPVVYHAVEHKDDNFPHYILAAGEHTGVRFYVCSINGSHPCAYLRIPKGKCLWGESYDYAGDFLLVHGGITYAAGGLQGVENDDDSWFVGWDYGHYGDFIGCYLRYNQPMHYKKWTIDEIIKECCDACEALAELWRIDND